MIKSLWLSIAVLLVTVACGAAESPEPKSPLSKEDITPAIRKVSTATRDPMPEKATQNAPAAPSPIPTAAASSTPEYTITFFAADDERIRYIGRFDFRDPKNPAFDWSASAVEFAFDGTAVTIILEDGRNYYNVHVDDQVSVLKSEPNQTSYVIADNLQPGEHQVRIAKRTEAYVGAAVFKGLQITGRDLIDPGDENRRFIEFIGDSITAGYGNEGKTPECWFSPQTENAEESFAAFTANELDADYSLVALSGLGIARNLRDENAASSQTAIDFIDRALGMNPTVIWPPDLNPPTAVVINLGTNDFSSIPFPEEEVFVGAYIELLQAVRARYPLATIFALSGPLMLDPAPQTIQVAVDKFTASEGDDQIRVVLIEDNLERSAVDFGCDWHPNTNGQRKIAEQLAPVMASELGW